MWPARAATLIALGVICLSAVGDRVATAAGDANAARRLHTPSNLAAPTGGDPCRLLPDAIATDAALAQVGLQTADLPGAMPAGDVTGGMDPVPPDACTAHIEAWISGAAVTGSPENVNGAAFELIETLEALITYPTADLTRTTFDEARRTLIAHSAAHAGRVFGSMGVGDDDLATFALTVITDDDMDTEGPPATMLFFRRGRVIAVFTRMRFGGDDTGDLDELVRLGRIVDGRLVQALR